MTFETLLYQIHDSILTITLNRPDKLNALTPTLLRELKVAMEQAGADSEVRAVVVTGARRGFCSGADLITASQYMAEGNISFSQMLTSTYNPLILTMQALPKPIIAVINGVAAGAGMSLALACDYRLAAESASFIQAFVKIGLVPDSGSTWMLPRLIGMTRAMDMMLTGRKVSAQEALDWGMVNRVVPDGQLAETAHQVASDFAAMPTRTLGLIKQAAVFAATSSLEQALFKEAELQDAAGATADHQEGVMAFLEKRPARFRGE